MTYTSIAISSGHGAKISGAVGPAGWGLNEHKEAVRVVDSVAAKLRARGVKVATFEDKTSTSQSVNLNTIVAWHNSQSRQLDVSVHFNAYLETNQPRGTECLYLTQLELADKISDAIASVGFVNRGPKKRTDLAFLNGTSKPAVLIEVCFVDSSADAHLYQAEFDAVCESIAMALSGEAAGVVPSPVPPEDFEEPGEGDYLFSATGKCSYFGGPDDTGVAVDEGLAFHSKITKANQHLFLPIDTGTGLARRLNAEGVHYVACRWDYNITPKKMLAGTELALVTNEKTGAAATAFCADWGPAGPESDHDTGRVADLSPALMRDLNLETDDVVSVVYPWREPP